MPLRNVHLVLSSALTHSSILFYFILYQICDQYGLGVSGLDADSFAVALLLLYKLPLLQAAPAFLTPHDAFSAFDPGRYKIGDL